MSMKILKKINESILLSILLPIVAISAVVTVIAVSLLIKSFDSFQRAQVEADLTLAAQLAVDIAEGGLHDLLALRLEKDPNSIETYRNQTLEEIKQISKKFHNINLLVIENQHSILASSQDIPQDQVKLPELRLKKSPVLTADLWGEPLLLHYQYFPLWRWHIISYMQGKDYAALMVFTQRFLYFAVCMGVAIILLTIMAVFHTRVNLPLKSLVRTAAAVGQGKFVSMVIKRRDEIGQVKQALNDMVINLYATQKALKGSEATLQSLFRAAPIGIGLVQERVILFVNEQILRMTGYSLGEFQGQTSRIFYPSEEEFHRVGEVKYDEIKQFGTGTVETQWRHKKGHLIEVLLSSSFIVPGDPGSGTVFTAMDITARRRTEEALRHSEARYRELVENANSIILRMDAEGVITFFNEFAERFFGYAKGEILGRNAVGTIVPARDSYGRDQQALIQDMRLHPERYANLESESVKRSGARVWVAWTNRAIIDHQGQVTEILCVGSDVTARRQAEMERQKAMAQLQTSLDQSISGIIIADAPDGAIRYANPAALNIRGETDLPLTGIDISFHSRHWQIYRPEGTPYPTEEVPLSRAVLRGEITRNEEVVIVNAKGQKRWVLTNAAPVRNNEGTIISGIVVFHDITERKRADEELSLYKDHLEDLVKERTAALTESEARFRVIFDGAGVGIVLRDLNGRVLAINQAYEKMVGYAQEEMADVGWSFLHPQDAPRFLSQFQELAEGSR
ncbi:MAG: PAS domain S-box protein, partial [Desulfobaccales bacterium]